MQRLGSRSSGAAMRSAEEIFELAECYWSGQFPGEELPELARLYPLPAVEAGVNALADVFIRQDVARFVLAAELPLVLHRDGCWSINDGDKRVKDFPPE